MLKNSAAYFLEIFSIALLAFFYYLALPETALAQSDGERPANIGTTSSIMLGWAERARIFPGNLPIQAKLDTGANTSSLNVSDYQLFIRGGKQWAKIIVLNRANARREYELEVVRISKIKNLHGPITQRPVVKLDVCIANIRRTAEVNLSRRKGFIYKLLLGRRFLANIITVDPARKFTTKPNCQRSGNREPGRG